MFVNLPTYLKYVTFITKMYIHHYISNYVFLAIKHYILQDLYLNLILEWAKCFGIETSNLLDYTGFIMKTRL